MKTCWRQAYQCVTFFGQKFQVRVSSREYIDDTQPEIRSCEAKNVNQYRQGKIQSHLMIQSFNLPVIKTIT